MGCVSGEEYTNGLMEAFMRVNGKQIKWMAEEHIAV